MYPWSTRLCPHPTILKKMKTFLEVEGRMGPIPQPTSSQYRPPQLDTKPNVRKDTTVEKRKRAVPTKRFRPSTAPKSSRTAMHPPATVSKALASVTPQTNASENRPPPWKMSQFVNVLHGPVLERCQETSMGQKLVASSQLLEQ